jgi:hypothetical protein
MYESSSEVLNDTIQWAGWNKTPEHTYIPNTLDCPSLIKQKIKGNALHKAWHRFRTSESKRLLNKATQEFKQLLSTNRNDYIQTFLQSLTPADSTHYSVWKVTKKIKQITKFSPPRGTPQGTSARNNTEKAHAFAKHLTQVFQPHPLENSPEEQKGRGGGDTQLLETPYQFEPPINRLKRTEVQEVINSLNLQKSPGNDLITGKILEELPAIGIQYLTQLFNAGLLKGYFPAQWKVTHINLIPNPGNPPPP